MIAAAHSHTARKAANFEFTALHGARNYRNALLRQFSPWLRGRVLEVGAGIGQMTALLQGQSTITTLVAIEPDERFAGQFREAVPNVQLISGTVAAVGTDHEWDAIVSINVLEHIEDDRDELHRYQRLLARRAGALCLLVPARPEIYAPIDEQFGHFRRYKRAEMKSKLAEAGLALEYVKYFNLIGYFAWWWMFRVLKRRSFNPTAVRLFDRCIFPAANAVERLLPPPPLGQSLVAVARAR